MKIKLNPMAQMVKRAERRINMHRGVSPQDLAHDRKRQMAAAVKGGQVPTTEFVRAAAIEGTSPEALALVILAKPDAMMAAENARRALIVAVRAAKTAAELDALMTGIPDHPEDRRAELT
jgi:hypothetical protein